MQGDGENCFFSQPKSGHKSLYTVFIKPWSRAGSDRTETAFFFKISAKIQILPFWSFCHFLIEGCFIQSKLLVFPLSLHVKLHTHKNAPFPACNVFCRTHLGPCNFHSTISHLGYQYFSHFFPGFLILKPVCFFTWLQPRFRKFNTTSIMYWLTYTRFRGAIIFF